MYFSKFVGIALALVLGPLSAHGETVTGELTADNHFMINLSYGSGNTSTVVQTLGGWTSVEDISFDIDTARLGTCSVQILAWDNPQSMVNRAGGLIGYLTGNAGTVATGSSIITLHETGQSASGFATLTTSDFETWIAASTNPATSVLPMLVPPNPTSPWVPLSFSNPPSNLTWIWDRPFPLFGNDEILSFVIPCAALVTDTPPTPFDEDHFSCYKPIKLQEPSEKVELKIEDQFGEGTIVLGDPVLHCNPSRKRHNGAEFGIENKERHLVCYEIIKQSPVYPPAVEIENQIGTSIYAFDQDREMFCVPSSKEEM
ncbi:DUF7450 family protein [Celeribacter marinus]|uniref:DUF7450 family protein n=1 Tax=Celeribacter marinus TaxID=1397108 RepID=UPI003F6A7220